MQCPFVNAFRTPVRNPTAAARRWAPPNAPT
jgi:hypothetical protein